MPRPEAQAASLRDILYVLFRYKTAILVAVGVSVLAPALYALLTFPVYRAEARLLVKLGRESFSGIAPYSKEPLNVLIQARPQYINNEIEILRRGRYSDDLLPRLRATIESMTANRRLGPVGRLRLATARAAGAARDLVLAPLRELGVARQKTPDEALLAAVSRALHVSSLEDTDMIRVAFTWTDPEIAAAALNVILDAYMELHIRIYGTGQSQEFYSRQLELYADTLRTMEQEIKDFTTSRSISNIELQKELLLRDLSDLEKRRAEIAGMTEDIKAKMQKVREMYREQRGWVETPKMGAADFSALSQLDDQYFRLQGERGRYSVDSPEAQRLDREMARLRTQKSTSVLNVLAAELTAKSKEQGLLDGKNASKQARFDELNSLTMRLDDLERRRDAVKNTVASYERKTEEFRVSGEMDAERMTSVKVVSPARPPMEPAFPRLRLVLLVAVFAGLSFGLLYALVAHGFDHTFRSEDDVAEALGVPLLVSLPARRVAKPKPA